MRMLRFLLDLELMGDWRYSGGGYVGVVDVIERGDMGLRV